jgi:hypothetical protein
MDVNGQCRIEGFWIEFERPSVNPSSQRDLFFTFDLCMGILKKNENRNQNKKIKNNKD